MNGKNEDGDGKKGLKGIFGFLGAPKRQALSAEDEIKDFVADSDDLLDDEKRMIHEILDLGDMDAGEIMTPRVDMILVEDTETVRQAVDRMMGTGYSRLPVFQGDIDRIVGVVHYKDLVPPVLDGHGDDLAVDYAFEPLFVEDAVEMGWPLAESEDYETIAGWVLSMLDTVPQMGYSFEKDGYRFNIHSMRRRRILAVRVERISDDAPQASDGKAGQEER